jgi:hypothetical protein
LANNPSDRGIKVGKTCPETRSVAFHQIGIGGMAFVVVAGTALGVVSYHVSRPANVHVDGVGQAAAAATAVARDGEFRVQVTDGAQAIADAITGWRPAPYTTESRSPADVAVMKALQGHLLDPPGISDRLGIMDLILGAAETLPPTPIGATAHATATTEYNRCDHRDRQGCIELRRGHVTYRYDEGVPAKTRTFLDDLSEWVDEDEIAAQQGAFLDLSAQPNLPGAGHEPTDWTED